MHKEFYLKVCLSHFLLSIFRYLVLDIADNPVENIIRFFPMVSVSILISFKIYLWCDFLIVVLKLLLCYHWKLWNYIVFKNLFLKPFYLQKFEKSHFECIEFKLNFSSYIMFRTEIVVFVAFWKFLNIIFIHMY